MTREERLADERTAWLCSLRPDGSPHVTPVWFIYTSEPSTWWIGSRATNVKVANLRADPRVSVHLPDAGHPVVAEGRASVVEGPDFPNSVLDRFVGKYGWNPAAVDGTGAPRVLLHITVDRWLMKG